MSKKSPIDLVKLEMPYLVHVCTFLSELDVRP